MKTNIGKNKLPPVNIKRNRMLSGNISGDFKSNPDAIFMLLPAVVMFMVFCIYPVINVFILGFTEYDGMNTPEFIGLYNYTRAFKDATWWTAVLNTFIMGFGTVLLQIPSALLLAVILNSKLRAQNFFRAAIFMPNITSQAVMGMIFFFIFQTESGILNEFLKTAGIIKEPVGWLGSDWMAKFTVVIFATWFHTGLKMVLFLAALQKIPADVYESSSIDGASRSKTFIHITLPMLGGMFRIIVMLSIIDAMKLFDSIKTLTDGGPAHSTDVMATYIFNYYFSPDYVSQQGYASAVSMIATVIIALVAVIYLKTTSKMAED
jgi:raffinose/stachyose/melibiose transport system permease protein